MGVLGRAGKRVVFGLTNHAENDGAEVRFIG